jgi:two-component system cell cycle response regulator DivK
MAAGGRVRRALVVEDDAHNAMLFRKLLEKRCGCQVTVTESVEEILGLCRGGAVELVIMDVSLNNSRWENHGISGVEICRLLKQDPATAHIPVVLATAHAMRGDAETLMAESGADDYVAKPIVDHEEFVKRIRTRLPEAA